MENKSKKADVMIEAKDKLVDIAETFIGQYYLETDLDQKIDYNELTKTVNNCLTEALKRTEETEKKRT